MKLRDGSSYALPQRLNASEENTNPYYNERSSRIGFATHKKKGGSCILLPGVISESRKISVSASRGSKKQESRHEKIRRHTNKDQKKMENEKHAVFTSEYILKQKSCEFQFTKQSQLSFAEKERITIRSNDNCFKSSPTPYDKKGKEKFSRSMLLKSYVPVIKKCVDSKIQEDDSLLKNYNDNSNNVRSNNSQEKTRSSNTRKSSYIYNSSLEDNVFHDISYINFIGNDKLNSNNNISLHKINGTPVHISDFSDQEDITLDDSVFLNHHERSHYRQKRREWYLNRRNISQQQCSTKITMSQNFKWSMTWILYIVTVYIIGFLSNMMNGAMNATKRLCLSRKKQSALNLVLYTIKLIFTDTLTQILINFFFIIKNIITYIKNKLFINAGMCVLGSIRHVSDIIKKLLLFFGYSLFFIGKRICLSGLEKIYLVLKSTLISTKFYLFIFIERIQSLMKRNFKTSTKECKEDDDDDDNEPIIFFTPCCLFSPLIITVLTILMVFVLGWASKVNKYTIPDPNILGIGKSYGFYLDEVNEFIPTWHFLPPSASNLKKGSEFDDRSPVIFYVRSTGNLHNNLRVEIFRTLVSLGYHVIVPLNILNKAEILSGWRWVKMHTKSSVYLWGDHLDASVLTNYAKDFCSQYFPPSGVIIETGGNKQKSDHRSLEIWSCNCTHVENATKDGHHKYTHVKCPLSNTEISREILYIISCIEAVNREIT